uniref:Uncharacterized protein n=1 Tax=Anguilla anguilla TaxID=7936 RepID=A0A0E9RZ03_ANGAN
MTGIRLSCQKSRPWLC